MQLRLILYSHFAKLCFQYTSQRQRSRALVASFGFSLQHFFSLSFRLFVSYYVLGNVEGDLILMTRNSITVHREYYVRFKKSTQTCSSYVRQAKRKRFVGTEQWPQNGPIRFLLIRTGYA